MICTGYGLFGHNSISVPVLAKYVMCNNSLESKLSIVGCHNSINVTVNSNSLPNGVIVVDSVNVSFSYYALVNRYTNCEHKGHFRVSTLQAL